MPPKVHIDVKLGHLRDYVASKLAELASRGKTTLKDIFASQKTTEEASFYNFLWASEEKFTDAQRAHAHETLALLRQHCESSGDLHPAAGVGCDSSPSGCLQRDRSHSAKRPALDEEILQQF